MRTFRIFISLQLSMAILTGVGFINALAEERFEIRNGIYLGDTFEEVLEKNDLGFQSEDYANYEENDDGEYRLWTNQGRIAGYDGTQVRYTFKDKILVDVIYDFAVLGKDFVDAQYEELVQSLTRKYGKPLGNSEGSCYIITTGAFSYASTLNSLWSKIGGVGDYRDYDEWLYTELTEYNVKIDIISSYGGSSYSDAIYSNYIGYTMYSDEDVEAAVAEKQAEQDERDNDL